MLILESVKLNKNRGYFEVTMYDTSSTKKHCTRFTINGLPISQSMLNTMITSELQKAMDLLSKTSDGGSSDGGGNGGSENKGENNQA